MKNMTDITVERINKGIKFFKTIGRDVWGKDLTYEQFKVFMNLVEEYITGAEVYYSTIYNHEQKES